MIAIHVHHGLQASADDFESHCRSLCEGLGISLVVCRVDARNAPGESPEDAARRARYQALASAAREAGLGHVLLAQHADDQVETLLLALSRGAGLPGLAAMPARRERDGVVFHRPWLGLARADIEAWLRARGLAWIDDPTNADPGFTRNRIRAELLPALERCLPSFRSTFARSAAHAAQGAEALRELGAQDLADAGDPPRLDRLHALSRPRQANLLRHWLRVAHGTSPTAAQLDELLGQIAVCRTRGHRIDLRVGSGRVLRDGERLGWRYN